MAGHKILREFACAVIIAVLLGIAHVTSADACAPRSAHRDVTLLGGLAAGEFTPWEPRETMGVTTLEKCSEHCCKNNRVDLVFMVNKYCFCVKCRSRRLCTLVKITPPASFRSYALVLARGAFRPSRTPTSASTRPNHSKTKPHQSRPKQPDAPTERRTTKGAEDVTKHGYETSDDRLGRGTVLGNSEGSSVGRKIGFFRFFSRKHHPHVAMIIRYFFFFLLGGLTGLIPYFIFLVQLCQADLAMKTASHQLPPTANALSNGGHVVAATSQSSGVTGETPKMQASKTTPPTTWRSTAARTTRVVTEEKTATGMGNEDILLQCPGSILITKVRYSAVEGDQGTVSRFNAFCQKNITKVKKLNQCAASLKKVYRTSYDDPAAKTELVYRCTYTSTTR